MMRTAFKTYSNLKFALYYGEFYNLFLLRKFLGNRPIYEVSDEQKQVFFSEIQKLIEKDYKIFEKKLLPYSCLKPEPPIRHLKRFGRILIDNLFLNHRRNKNKTKVFSKKLRETLDKFPEYYRRNFHFQTDGYLSEYSAEIYDHQVEMLFNGTADAMRRMLLPPIHDYMEKQHLKSPRILEIASGTGSSTRFIAQAFPEAKITCVDISKAYLKTAQQRLQNFNNIDYLECNAENLDFKDECYDIVFSVYLFHEVPLEVRKKIIAESSRVLKQGGLWLGIDSIQKHERPELQWSVDIFPREYHEPFYKNYTLHPLENLVSAYTNNSETDYGFLSKVVHFIKN